MFTKKVILFAVASMFAAGATLASNVSFGQRAARWIAQNMDFIGPISGLVNAVVRAPDANRNNPVLSFQTDRSGSSSDGFRAGNALQIAAYDAKYGVTQAAMSGTVDNSRSIAVQAGTQNTGGSLMSPGGGAIQFNGQVGDNQSNLNALAKSFLRDAKGIDSSDLLALLNSKGGSAGDFSTINIPSIVGSSLDKNSAADIPQILAAATNGDPLVAGAATNGQDNAQNGGAGATAAAGTTAAKPQSAATDNPASAKVPLPGAAGLLLIGLFSMVAGARTRTNRRNVK